jgi:hypothetical protein
MLRLDAAAKFRQRGRRVGTPTGIQVPEPGRAETRRGFAPRPPRLRGRFSRFLTRQLQELPRRAELRDLQTWRQAKSLVTLLKREGYTMVGARHGRTLYRLAVDIERRGVPGVLVDCGVWNGGSTILLSNGAPSRSVWAFDSFEGMPQPGDRDAEASWEWVGECRGSEERLREGFAHYASEPEQLRVRPGWFEQTFRDLPPELDTVALLHVDADWYEPVKLVLETFYPRLAPGGIVILDDYSTWTGARRAVDEFRADHNISEPFRPGHYWQKEDPPFQ